MILAVALGLILQEGWEYRPAVRSFVQPDTMEQKTPEELFAHGERFFNGGEPSRARSVFQILAESLPSEEPPLQVLRERSLFAAARCAYAAGDYLAAFGGFDGFLVRHPDSELASGPQGARYWLCQSAFNLAQVGLKESVLGVPLYRSSRAGIDLLKKALMRYPRESFSDDFYLALGELLLQQGRLDEAETEFRFILTPGQYDRTNSAPRAQLKLARLNLRKFDGVDYDVKMLDDSKREYEKFLSAWGRALEDPQALAALDLTGEALRRMLDEASAGIAEIDEKLAEKQWAMASYYLRHGRESSARVYLRSIVSDYPRTSWAARAAERLRELDGP